MAEFIFECGKNFSISIAEIVCYLEARAISFTIVDYSNNFLVIDTLKIPDNMIEDLGGTIKIAQGLFTSKQKDAEIVVNEIRNELNFKELFKEFSEKVTFGVSSYNAKNEYLSVANLFKEKMKEEGIKASFMHPHGKTLALTHVEVIKKQLVEKSIEIVICRGKFFHLGKTIGVHNPYEFKKRDIGRPVQRTMFSIPPRLCKIMINMSKIKEGVMLDPFCGIGAILQEAVLMGFDICGIDNDALCIEGCIKNLEWLEKEYVVRISDLNKKVKEGDARKLSHYFEKESIDSIVAEPYLGPALKKTPDCRTAEKIIASVNSLYIEAIRESVKVLKPGCRIVIVSPSFLVKKELLGLDVAAIATNNRCKIIDPLERYQIPHEFPFLDFDENHRTLREINIIEKGR